MYITDSFISTGRSHPLCQDFCLNSNSKNPRIILSDGCSSSLNTETGSHILVRIANKILENNYYPGIEDIIIKDSDEITSKLGLNIHSLDCTLLMLIKNENYFTLSIAGDGGYFFLRDNDELEIHKFEYSHNMPKYLSYKLNKQNDEEYRKLSENEILTQTVYSFKTLDNIVFFNLSHNCIDLIVRNIDINSKKIIGIFSDGLSSFINPKTRERKSEADIIKELVSFKSTEGLFLKKRANRVLDNLAKEGYYNYDDFSIGMILRKD